MKTKFLVFLIGLSLLISFDFAQAQATTTTSDLETLAQTLRQQIEELRERILQLQEELKETTKELKEVDQAVKFTQNLHKGLRDKEVERLQEFLSGYPEIYPEGLVTGYFGSLTEKAVQKFQEKHSEDILKPYGLNKGTGFVGEKTIIKINELLTEGAGVSGQVPSGLTTAPGLQEKLATTTESERKITICHYPPAGNPNARHTIIIAESALEAHLAHGDTIGPCPTLYCGDGTCNNGETCSTCFQDCGVCPSSCGDDTCDVTESCSTCSQDCGTCPVVDTTPPILSNGQPTGTLVTGTTQTTLSLQTNENATCKYSNTAGVSYISMTNTFLTTGTTNHSASLLSLTNGSSYNYYIRCQDIAGNVNMNDYIISFSVAEPVAILGCTDSTATNYNSDATEDDGSCVYPDIIPPIISNFQPSGTITDLTPTLSLNTNENATCRYSTADQSFDAMLSTFSGVGATYHYITMGTMTVGTYTYYARCQDTAGNKNTDSASITFTITTEADTTAPIISNIQVSNITETSVTITWQTNEESDSVVNYGLTTSYGSTVSGEENVIYHEVNLTNLTNGTTYHYKVNSTDNAGNKAESGDRTFATYAPPIAWENIQITDVGSSTRAPSLDWSGDGYGLAWKDGRNPIPYGAGADIYFVKLDADGIKITNEINLTVDNPMESFYPKIIWNGSEFGIIWEYRYDVMNPISDDEPTDCSLLFTKVSNSGVHQGGNVQVVTRTTADIEAYVSCPAEADMVWDGTGYGVVWKERRVIDEAVQIYFRRIDANGQPLTDDIEVTQAPYYKSQPSIVWTGTEYGVAWHDDRDLDVYPEIYFVQLDTAGAKQGSEIRITNTLYNSWKPDLHWNGSGYDLFWMQDEAGRLKQIYFAKLNSSGNKITNDIAVTVNASNNYPVSPHAVWDGINYGVAWTLTSWVDEEYDDVEYIIYFAKVDPNGSIINLPARVFAGSFAAEPAISWSGSKYGIAWSAPPGTGGYDIYFASDLGEVAILEQEQQLSFIDRLLKNIQSQVAAVSAAILELLIK